MNNKIKCISFFCLSFLCVFLLGGYVTNVLYSIKSVEPHQWFLSSMFGLFFFISGLDKYDQWGQ